MPHAFLVAAYPAKLQNFLARGSTVSFEPSKDDLPEDGEEEKAKLEQIGAAPLPDPNAVDRIPTAWSTVDRILNVWYRSRAVGQQRDAVEFKNAKKMPEDPMDHLPMIELCYFKRLDSIVIDDRGWRPCWQLVRH